MNEKSINQKLKKISFYQYVDIDKMIIKLNELEKHTKCMKLKYKLFRQALLTNQILLSDQVKNP